MEAFLPTSYWPITHWHWVFLGITLLTLEILSLTTVLLWASAAAFLTAALAFWLPETNWQQQALCFALSTAVLLWATHSLLRRRERNSPSAKLNRRAEALIGQIHMLTGSIEHGRGRLNIHDTLWTLSGPDLPRGSEIKIVAVEDAVLVVEEYMR